jgi:deferrochelatase/peroxidase EfeB
MHKIFKSFQTLAKTRHFATGVAKRTNLVLPLLAFTAFTFSASNFVKPVFAETKKTKPVPQATVTTGNHAQCGILVITLKNTSDFEEFVRAASKLPQIVTSLSVNKPTEGDDLPELMAGVGFDSTIWKDFATKKGLKIPEGLGPYKTRSGNFGDLPYTKHEVILHVKANTRSLVYETIDAFLRVLPKDKIASFNDYYGWQYKDGRDLSGFL